LAHTPKGEQINYMLQTLNHSHSSVKIAGRVPILAETLSLLSKHMRLDGAVVLEIGTGWEPINPLLLHLAGAKVIYSYDHLPHLRFKLAGVTLEELESSLALISASTSVPESMLRKKLAVLKSATDLPGLFTLANIKYVAPGDATRSGLPDHSVDLVYSHAVLEHVPEETIHAIALESNRVLRPGGLAFHFIGPFDHYASVDKRISMVNFLQYPEWKWKLFVKNKISYHNRLRAKEFVQIFRSHGAEVLVVRDTIEPSDLEALKRMKIDARFGGMTHEELAVSRSEILYLAS
jgi:ubiquinone/menaquinone biosynthesis C-methylase UbiE